MAVSGTAISEQILVIISEQSLLDIRKISMISFSKILDTLNFDSFSQFVLPFSSASPERILMIISEQLLNGTLKFSIKSFSKILDILNFHSSADSFRLFLLLALLALSEFSLVIISEHFLLGILKT